MPDLSIARRFLPDADRRRVAENARRAVRLDAATSPTPIRGYRDNYGVTYIIVQQQHGEEFAKVIAELR